MRAYLEKGTLFLVPECNLVASQIEEIRNFLLAELQKNTDEENVVLDVKGIEVIDSLGVNLIIGLYKETKAKSKTLSIIHAGEKFMKIADFFKFQSIFDIETDTEKSG